MLALNVAPDAGIFMGQTAVVSLRAGSAAPSVVRAPAAMRMSVRPVVEHTEVGPLQYLGPQGFPSVPIGVIAHIKQTLADAQHQAIAPEPNAALDALVPVVQRRMPLIIPAQEERHIRRAVDLSEQFDLSAIVAGGYEAPELAAELKRRKMPVLISLNFPLARHDNPEADEPVREAHFRRHAPQAAGELASAQVPFAFYSDGLTSGRAFLQSLRLTVKRGLSRRRRFAARRSPPRRSSASAGSLAASRRALAARQPATGR